MITVEYAPGGSDPVHRHNAPAVLYVLEGSVVMQVRGCKEVTLTPGQVFYEGADDVHIVGRNASGRKPAKFLVFFVKKKGAPVLVPATECWNWDKVSMRRIDVRLRHPRLAVTPPFGIAGIVAMGPRHAPEHVSPSLAPPGWGISGRWW